MVEMADIIRRHGPAYLHQYDARILPSHRKAMQDIGQCRTPDLGGTTYRCKDCTKFDYSYHSCCNRACPKCGNNKTTEWIGKQKALLLPVPYFLVTFTVPGQARKPTRSHQKTVYSILMTTAWHALQKLAWDPRHLGARLGAVAVLQTWKRDMGYHPHVHFLVPAGGLAADRSRWVPTRNSKYLVPEKPLAIIFKAKFREAIIQAGLSAIFPSSTWAQGWVVDAEFVGSGKEAIKYLAPYMYRTAISNKRIVSLHEGDVTYCYKDNQDRWHNVTLPAKGFLSRFLQHVLPKGFQRIRYYGFLHSAARESFNLIRSLLGQPVYQKPEPPAQAPPRPCPHCGGTLTFFDRFRRGKRGPP
jgi:putative transposase/transposase-like zinc-binding protein